MKKTIAILLLLALVLGLVGCGPATPNTPTGGETNGSEASTDGNTASGFRVGYGRANITPRDSVPLSGYGNSSTRMSTGYLDYLFATCIAFTDEEDNTLLMFTADIIVTYGSIFNEVRSTLSQQTGIPQNHITCTATHSHSAIDYGNTSKASTQTAIQLAIDGMVKAGLDALEDRKPVTGAYTGSADVEGLNFVRHYLLDNDTYAGDNFGDFSTGEIVRHATEVNPTMYLLKITRQDAPDVVIANWRAHGTLNGSSSYYSISADFIGSLRDNMEADLGCCFAYFQGDAGNVNPKTRISSESRTVEYRQYGKLLAGYAQEGLENMTEISLGQIRVSEVTFSGKVNHSMDSLLTVAREIHNVWVSTNSGPTCIEMGAPYGIRSPYHADAIISKASFGLTSDLVLEAVSIGDSFGVVMVPFEMFDTNGDFIRENSPFAMTFVYCYSNAHHGYIPSALGYEYTCYESDIGRFEAGTAEDIADTLVAMLTELKGA